MGRANRAHRVARPSRRTTTSISTTSISTTSSTSISTPTPAPRPSTVSPSLSSAPAVASTGQAADEFPLRRARRAAEQPTKTRIAGRRKPAVVRTERSATSPRRMPSGARRSKRTLFAQFVSMSAMVGVFGLLVSTSLPANAFYTADDMAAVAEATEQVSAASSLAAVAPQKVTVNAEAATAAAANTVTRDSYDAKSFQQQITALRGNPNYTYTNNPSGTIQWPFIGTVPISSGFGPRAVCSYCSSYHLGVDFTPGAGVPIQALTDGVVSAVNIDSGGFGNHVIIDHVVGGQRVQTLYAHMQWGSIQVAVGQQVSAGTVVGAVGNTGRSTGAHLHLEVRLDGTPVDPFAWLKANAN